MKDVITLDGVVIKTFAGAKFLVQFQNGHECICTASGKMRKNMIKIINGDKVQVEEKCTANERFRGIPSFVSQ